MTTINEIFQTFGPEYLQRYSHLMPKSHCKVIDAIIACRTEASGLALYECEKCGQLHRVYRSCGNRHCPTCQHHKTRQWIEKQLKRQLPGHHFLLTFPSRRVCAASFASTKGQPTLPSSRPPPKR